MQSLEIVFWKYYIPLLSIEYLNKIFCINFNFNYLQLEAEVLAQLFHHQITTILPITLNIHLPMEAIVMEVQGVCWQNKQKVIN